MVDNKYYEEDIVDIVRDAKRYLDRAFNQEFKALDLRNYIFCPEETAIELDLDVELVNELVEEYVKQIIETEATFIVSINRLKQEKSQEKELDYTTLRNLAHKNLGVAKNLRIHDAIAFLTILLKADNLKILQQSLTALIMSATILKPKVAYEEMIKQ